MFRALLFLFLSSCAPSFCTPHYQLSVCTIFQNEASYLKEWIEFHRLMGVEHFYLCSHNSTDHYRKVLIPYIKKGVVELKEIRSRDFEAQADFNTLQLQFYNDCLVKARKTSRWVAFIDSDEFLFPTQADTLIDFLLDYRDFAAVAANWQMFGTSQVSRLLPGQLMIEQLTRCGDTQLEEINSPVKCIVQPTLVFKFHNDPHSPAFRPGYYQVNSDKIPFLGPFSPYIQIDKLRINHYWTRDEHYFWNVKVPRQTRWTGFSSEELQHIPDKYNQYVDLSILRFAGKLRRLMRM